jgi:hypothetical protein
MARAGDHVQTHCARRSRAAGLRAACACARAALFSAAVPGLAIFTKVRSCGVNYGAEASAAFEVRRRAACS